MSGTRCPPPSWMFHAISRIKASVLQRSGCHSLPEQLMATSLIFERCQGPLTEAHGYSERKGRGDEVSNTPLPRATTRTAAGPRSIFLHLGSHGPQISLLLLDFWAVSWLTPARSLARTFAVRSCQPITSEKGGSVGSRLVRYRFCQSNTRDRTAFPEQAELQWPILL